MEQEISIVVTLTVASEYSDEFKGKLPGLVEQTRKESGNVFYIPHIVPEASDKFVFYERWADQAALDYHMDQPYLKDFLAYCEASKISVNSTICREIKY